MKKILVVDDNPDILDAIQFVLEGEGYSVTVTEKGEYAENLHKNGLLPDLIILDVLMSGKDGRSICKKLKAAAVTRNIPIIMISAHPDIHKATQEAGADDFLAKPFDINKLINKIEKYLQI